MSIPIEKIAYHNSLRSASSINNTTDSQTRTVTNYSSSMISSITPNPPTRISPPLPSRNRYTQHTQHTQPTQDSRMKHGERSPKMHDKNISMMSCESAVSDEQVLGGAFGGHIATASEIPIRQQRHGQRGARYLAPYGAYHHHIANHHDHQREIDSAEELEQTSSEYYDDQYDSDVHQTVGPPPSYPPPRGSTIDRRRAIQIKQEEHAVVELATMNELQHNLNPRKANVHRHGKWNNQRDHGKWANNVQRMLSEEIVIEEEAESSHLDANGHDRTKTVMYEMEHTPDNEDEYQHGLHEDIEGSEQLRYGDHRYYDQNTSTSDEVDYDDYEI